MTNPGLTYYELNLDGLVGPTHHYAGLAFGNLASTNHARRVSNPAEAAHQGIKKMRLIHQLGIKQAVLPPQQRPNLSMLYQLGFTGTPQQQLQKAYQTNPSLVSACYSASSMWTANTATVAPSLDTLDKRVHFTAANLVSNLHRYQEADFSSELLARLFHDKRYFHHHSVLPKTAITADEGAANHSRLALNHQTPGVHLFVYGKRALPSGEQQPAPQQFPARQTREASEALARKHQLNPKQVVFACQNPAVIDLGVFHNDVIATANESVLLLHEASYVNQQAVITELQEKCDFPVHIIEISAKQLSVREAVASYLFNSQLLTLPNHTMALVAPIECQQSKAIQTVINELLANPQIPINQVHYLDLKQSMHNGGGPACLRLRILLNEAELAAMHQGIVVNDALLDALDNWVDKYYRDILHVADLIDPALVDESLTALDALTALLKLGSIYPFQREETN